MTSPNRETEAQQVEARVEQIVLTKVKASLGIKRGEIRLSLVQVKTITDQEPEEMGMRRISIQDHQETAREVALNPEKVEAIISDQEQEEMERRRISTQDHQETAREALNPEKVTEVISDQDLTEMVMLKADLQEMAKEAVTNLEKAEMANAEASDQQALEVVPDHQVLNHVHLKKAVLKKCQEMKAVVM
jgi:hypothetical protein